MHSCSSLFSCASTLGLALYNTRKNVHFDLEDILCKLSNWSIKTSSPTQGRGSLERHTIADKINIKGTGKQIKDIRESIEG